MWRGLLNSQCWDVTSSDDWGPMRCWWRSHPGHLHAKQGTLSPLNFPAPYLCFYLFIQQINVRYWGDSSKGRVYILLARIPGTPMVPKASPIALPLGVTRKPKHTNRKTKLIVQVTRKPLKINSFLLEKSSWEDGFLIVSFCTFRCFKTICVFSWIYC